MNIEDKLQPYAEEISDILNDEEISYWESILILEMVKQSLNVLWIAKTAEEFRK